MRSMRSSTAGKPSRRSALHRRGISSAQGRASFTMHGLHFPLPGTVSRLVRPPVGAGWPDLWPHARTTPPRVRGAGVLFVVRTHSLPFTRKEATQCPTLSAPPSRRSPSLTACRSSWSFGTPVACATPRDGAGRRRRGAPGNDGRDLLLDRDPRRLAADGLSRCLGDALSPSRPHPGLFWVGVLPERSQPYGGFTEENTQGWCPLPH